MPRSVAPPSAVPAGGRVQTRGPMGPSEPEITIHAGLTEGALDATPASHAIKGKAVTLLVTDDASCAARFPNRDALLVGEEGSRAALRSARDRLKALPVEERTMVVAGSAALLAAALDDAFRVVLVCPADAVPPHAIAHWRSSRTKGADHVALTRD